MQCARVGGMRRLSLLAPRHARLSLLAARRRNQQQQAAAAAAAAASSSAAAAAAASADAPQQQQQQQQAKKPPKLPKQPKAGGNNQGNNKGNNKKGGGGGNSASAESGSSAEEIRAVRLQKAADLRAQGRDPYAPRFDRTHLSAALQAQFRDLPPGEEVDVASWNGGNDGNGGSGTTAVVAVAGRVVARRVMGKLAFLSLRDDSGSVQLYVDKARLDAASAPSGEADGGAAAAPTRESNNGGSAGNTATPSAAGGGFAAVKSLVDVGDIVGATGARVRRTDRGELSVVVDDVRVLTKSLLPLPDKWHGLSDVEKRYRQRYVDLIVTEQSRRTLRARSRVVSALRRALEARSFLEVETPVLETVAGGADARPFATYHNALARPLTLRIATELHLKRLVVGGFERVFELGRVFRNEGVSSRHNPEFTSVEVYQAYADYEDMMELTEHLVRECALAVREELGGGGDGAAAQKAAAAAGAGGGGGGEAPPAADAEAEPLPPGVVDYQGVRIDLSKPFRRATMAELVRDATGVDFLASFGGGGGAAGAGDVDGAKAAALSALEQYSAASADSARKAAARKAARKVRAASSVGRILNEMFEAVAEADLVQPTFVLEHPIDVSPLAKPHRAKPGVTERFELFVAGRELANAFSELTDPVDQRQRLEAQVAAHRAAAERGAAAGEAEAGAAADDNGGGGAAAAADDDDKEAAEYDVAVDEDFLAALEYGMPPCGGLGIGVDRLVMLLTDAPSIRDVIAFPAMRPVPVAAAPGAAAAAPADQ